MTLDLQQTLGELVAIPSVNPMGRGLTGPEFLEHRVTAYLEDLFRRLGLPFRRQTIEPQRDNIVALLDGSPSLADGGRLVLLEAHQDTVPVDDMVIPPFTPQVRDGRLYGRGACDIKGGLTAMLGALARLAHELPSRRPAVALGCTVNEEHGFSGAKGLTQFWSEGFGGLLPRAPDVAIVAEPTLLDVVVAHKGAVRWRCHTHGRAAHSSQPEQGDNAIYRMARVVAALERYQRDETCRFPSHRLCGGVTLSVGTIRGGLSVNTVPERCTIEIDRRVLPGEDPTTAYEHVLRYVRQQTMDDQLIEHEPPFLTGLALADGPNGPLGERLATAAAAIGHQAGLIGVPFGTDASTIAASGVPAVVFGPGSIAQAHTADEWLALDQLHQASEILYRFLLDEAALMP